MATDDQQVLVTGTAAAPASFRIPGNGQIQPKSVFATYDGTGAAGAFQPALKVISDGGEVVGIYPCDTSVQAGGTADVSWFPHVAAQKTAALPTVKARRTSTQVIPANAVGDLSWSDVSISDSGFYSWDAGSPSVIHVLQAGTYMAWLSILPDTDWPQSGGGFVEWAVQVTGAGNITTELLHPFAQHPSIDVYTPAFAAQSIIVGSMSVIEAYDACTIVGAVSNSLLPISSTFTVATGATMICYRLADSLAF